MIVNQAQRTRANPRKIGLFSYPLRIFLRCLCHRTSKLIGFVALYSISIYALSN